MATTFGSLSDAARRYMGGNNVYNGGTPAATTGTLDPVGYINRESQKRSGLAAAALNTPTPAGVASPMSQVGGITVNRPIVKSKTGRITTAETTSTAEPLSSQFTSPERTRTPHHPPVPIPPGLFSGGGSGAGGISSVPYDPTADPQYASGLAAYNNAIQQAALSENNAEQNYDYNAHWLQQQEPNNLRDLLNNFASRGMAFGSGYGTSVGNENNRFAHQIAGLDLTKQQAIAAAQLQQSLAQQNWASLQQALLKAAAQRALESSLMQIPTY